MELIHLNNIKPVTMHNNDAPIIGVKTSLLKVIRLMHSTSRFEKYRRTNNITTIIKTLTASAVYEGHPKLNNKYTINRSER